MSVTFGDRTGPWPTGLLRSQLLLWRSGGDRMEVLRVVGERGARARSSAFSPPGLRLGEAGTRVPVVISGRGISFSRTR